MERLSDLSLSRRALIGGVAAGAGLLIARGFGTRGIGQPGSYAQTLRQLGASLTPRQRELAVFAADDPTRQIVNTSSVIERPHLGTLFSPQQRRLIEALYLSMLSPSGVSDFAPTVAVEGRFDGCVLAIYGDPHSGQAETVIQGGHLMLRGGAPAEAESFGGFAYGHQTGNTLWRTPGNSFAYHSDAANHLFTLLDDPQRRRCIQVRPPHELVLQVQNSDGAFHGVAISSLSEAAQKAAQQLVTAVLSPYPEARRRQAWSCIDANGGLGGLHFATYASHGFYEDMRRWGELDVAERARRGAPYWQVWRLEGPGTVVHFKGHPHVHAYVQIVRDPTQPRVGATLATTAVTVEGAAMRRLLEAALRRATGEATAFYGDEIPGRFCAGEVTTGLAYALDPYRNHVVVATIDGSAMAEPLRRSLGQQGLNVEADATYRVATTNFAAEHHEQFGTPRKVESSPLLVREALVAHLRADGLKAAQA